MPRSNQLLQIQLIFIYAHSWILQLCNLLLWFRTCREVGRIRCHCQINGFSPTDTHSGARIPVKMVGPIGAYEFFCASKYHSLDAGSRSRAGPEAHQEVFWRQLLKDRHCMTMPFTVFCVGWSVQRASVMFTCTCSFARLLFLIQRGVKSLELQPPAQNRRWEAYTMRVTSSNDHAAICRTHVPNICKEGACQSWQAVGLNAPDGEREKMVSPVKLEGPVEVCSVQYQCLTWGVARESLSRYKLVTQRMNAEHLKRA